MEILKLKPVFKDYIWGGTRLRDDFGFECELDPVAEGWMLSCHKDGKSIIDGGEFDGEALEDIIEKYGKTNIVGTRAADFPYFPVLIKLIDAKDNLSIQVHPDDEYAARVEHEFGKTEIWYVLDATDDAKLIYGFKEKISADEFRKAIENNTLMDVLNVVNVKKGDLFFIEAGTVHAIGKGALIAEIQQNSNSTYRVYDYGRVGNDGKPRELHIDKAVDVAKTEPPKYEIKPFGKKTEWTYGTWQKLVECDLFTVVHAVMNTKADPEARMVPMANEESFNHVLILDGSGEIDGRPFKKGDSFFVPANYFSYNIVGEAEFLITKI